MLSLPESTLLSNGRDILLTTKFISKLKTVEKNQRKEVDPGHEENFITTHDSHTTEGDL